MYSGLSNEKSNDKLIPILSNVLLSKENSVQKIYDCLSKVWPKQWKYKQHSRPLNTFNIYCSL